MKKLKNKWQKYGTIIIVELIVILAIYLCTTTTYNMTYEIEYQKAQNAITSVSQLVDYDKMPFKTSGYFNYYLEGELNATINNAYDYNLKYSPYSFHWIAFNKNGKKLEESGSSDIKIHWAGNSSDLDGIHIERKTYILSDYFTDKEIKGFQDFYSSIDFKPGEYLTIDNVDGYFDDNKQYIPTEIIFRYTDSSTIHYSDDSSEAEFVTYSLKSIDNSEVEGRTYVTREGDTTPRYTHSPHFYFASYREELDSTKEVFNACYNKLEKDYYIYGNNAQNLSSDIESGYEFWAFRDILHSSYEGTKNDISSVALAICADINYMTLNNTDFQKYIIGEIIFCQFVGILIIYLLYKNNKRRRELDSMKYTFINAMAHEMKTPSAVIVNSVECVQEGIKPEKQSYYLDKVKKEGLHMNQLLLDMLTYTKLSDEERKLNKEKVDMEELFKEVCEHYTDSIEKKNIRLHWDVSAETIIKADRGLMEMVVDNYISNAVKYCKSSGDIKITLDGANVVVFNNGPHIHPTKISAIWEPLYVTDTSRKNREGSSGMGLAISSKILDLHGFNYKASNTVDGVEFHITFK